MKITIRRYELVISKENSDNFIIRKYRICKFNQR